jgi:hypothetical protein
MRLQRIYRILHADRSVPVTDRFLGPSRRFLYVTGRTRIGNFELIRHRGRDKTERMRMHVRTGNAFGLYLRHMASHALAFPDCPFDGVYALPASPCAGRWAMLYHDIPGIAGSLAPAAAPGSPCRAHRDTRAHDSVPVHHALHKIIALHAILVRRAIGKIIESSLPQAAVFELPENPPTASRRGNRLASRSTFLQLDLPAASLANGKMAKIACKCKSDLQINKGGR